MPEGRVTHDVTRSVVRGARSSDGMRTMKRADLGDCIARTIKRQFAQNLRTLRVQKRQSQDDFARAHGFDRTYVSQLERELSVPSLEIVARLAFGLGVTIAARNSATKRRSRSRARNIWERAALTNGAARRVMR